MELTDFIVGKSYRFSDLPEESNDEIEVTDNGSDYIGQNSIHIRHHETQRDVWFIWVGMVNEGIFKCVHNE